MKFYRALVCIFGLVLTLSAHADLASLFTNAPVRTGAIPRRPSFIVIQCRDLARGDLSCYGQTNYETPNLDRLAKEGVRFTNYLGGTGSPETTAMLLAGKYATDPGVTNLVAVLKQAGYRTGLIGEWMFDREPWRRGFDQFAGCFNDYEARDYFAPRIWRFPHVIRGESNRVENVVLEHEALYPNLGGKRSQYVPDLLFKAANNFIRIAAPDRANHWRPFFLLVNLSAPRSAAVGKDEFPVPSDAPFTSEPWPQAGRNRAALITRIDSNLGRLFEQLEQSKLTNNVAIIFTSSGAPARFANTNLNFMLPADDFSTTNHPAPHLPLIVKFPSPTLAGKVSGANVSVTDIAPTLLEMGYVRPEPAFTGTSLFQLMSAKNGTNAPATPGDLKPAKTNGR